jgi:hypothetical protein
MTATRTLLLLAACLLTACDGPDDDAEPKSAAPSAGTTAETHAASAAPVVLVDTTLPAATPSENEWEYHLRAEADLDGDGRPERASLIARVASHPEHGFSWDDGQPWQLYVQEPDGTRTDVYRRWVQLGSVEAHVSPAPSGTGRVILIVERLPSLMRIYEVAYAGPGRVTAVERFSRELQPASGFAPAHGEP